MGALGPPPSKFPISDDKDGRTSSIWSAWFRDIYDRVGGASSATAASVTSVPSGNLAASDVQSALNELQSDIDTRSTSTDLTTHISDTSTHGTASAVVGISDTQTLSSKTLTSPKVLTGIFDANGNEVLRTPATSSAVNDVTVTNAATAGDPTLSATGDDTNIDLALAGKGTGAVKISSLSYPTADGTAGKHLSTNGSGTIGFTTLIYPTSDGSANQVLSTNGSGTIGFSSPGKAIEPNCLINSSFDYWQRSAPAGVALDTASTYRFDRWKARYLGTGSVTASRSADTPDSLRENSVSFLTNMSTAADDVGVEMLQRIESKFSRKLTSHSASLSFAYNSTSDAPTEVNIEIDYADSQDTFSSVTSITTSRQSLTADGTWRTIVLENITMGANADNGVQVTLTLDNVGTTSTNGTIKITDVVLAKGATAVEFSYAGGTRAQELDLCRRTYQKSYGLDLPPATNTENGVICATGIAGSANSLTLAFNAPFKTTMRTASPTITLYSKTGSANTVSLYSTFADVGATPHSVAASDENGFYQVDANAGTPFTNPSPYAFHYVAEDEL